MPLRGLSVTGFESRYHKVATRHVFATRMLRAIGLWLALTAVGLLIGIAGYATFEGMSLTDSFLNAAMILSGMGPAAELKTHGRKGVCRLLCDLLRPHHRHRHRIRAGADLPSRVAQVPRGDDEGLSRARRISLRLDAGGFDDFAPLGALLGDEGAEFVRRVPLRDDAERVEAFRRFRPLEIGDQSGVEFVDDRFRRAGTSKEALPALSPS